MPGYEDAMFMMTEHMRFLRSANGVRLMAAFDMSMRNVEHAQDKYHELPDNVSWTLATQMLEGADPVYVSPRFVEMAEHAMASFQPEPVLPTDLFTAQGFAYLPKPLWVTDVHGDELPIRAIGWMPIRGRKDDGMEAGGLWVMMWVHRDDDTVGRSQMTPELMELIKGIPYASLSVVHSFWLPYNERAWELIEDESYAEASERQWKAVQVLWRLASQVFRTVETAPRAARRDAKRHGLDQEHVTVVKLRKTESLSLDPTPEYDEEGGGHLHVQFVVRGHWRNQWFPSKGEHRQVWINPYIKGPEDAPFQASKRVYELTR